VDARAHPCAALILAGWSRVWIGWWAALPFGALLLWAWLNPRVFSPPAFTDSWAAKAAFGERVWLNRDRVSIPPHHRLAPRLLTVVALLGTALVIWGVVALAVWPTLLGAVLAYGGKLWFTDRMVWLYEDMKDADPVYRSWLRPRP
jgi:hypothetical protein